MCKNGTLFFLNRPIYNVTKQILPAICINGEYRQRNMIKPKYFVLNNGPLHAPPLPFIKQEGVGDPGSS